MATVTPNFNWPVPTSTDLVRDGATAIEALGDSIDASLVDLKGGTTGQVLSKTSNTDMDFTWVAADDTNAIQNTIVDAKGDLIAATANDTPARLAVGANGETLVADSSTSTGLRYQANFAAGKNKIINGDFGIWQRGISFTASSGYLYTADRWRVYAYTSNSATVSQQTFTPGTAPVAGYEGQFFARATATNTQLVFEQLIEDVRTFAGQTVTVSFWAKSASAQTITTALYQNFGSGGSVQVFAGSATPSIMTSWARYSATIAIPSISGKTIGTSSTLIFSFQSAINNALDIWGVQIEAGSVATGFQTYTGTIQGELAACQRYYFRTGQGASTLYEPFSTWSSAYNTTTVDPIVVPSPVTMRVNPTALEFANIVVGDGVNAYSGGTWSLSSFGSEQMLAAKYQHGSAALTAFRSYIANSNNSTSGYLAFSAEL